MKYPIIAICCTIACLCSCKSKKVVTDYHEKTIVNSELSAYHNVATIDTTRTACMDILSQVLTIEETIKVTEYDAESGKPIKETETKRKTVQDTEKVLTKKESKGESVTVNDSLKHDVNIINDEDNETETVTENNLLESFGKWFGIIIGLAIVGYVLYLCIKKKIEKGNV